jgi:hypothetical protein
MWAAIGTCGGHEDGAVLVAGSAGFPVTALPVPPHIAEYERAKGDVG